MLIHTAKDLGLYVRDQRKAQKLSQSEVAAAVNLKQATISEFENKPETTQVETLFRILAAANLEIHIIPKGQQVVSEKQWDQPW